MSNIYDIVYIGVDGKKHRKDFFIHNEQSARDIIYSMRCVPLSIKHKTIHWWQKQYINKEYKVRFLRSIGFHVDMGMSPVKALKQVIEAEDSKQHRAELELAMDTLNRGGFFSDAIVNTKFFPPVVVSILKSGEISGTLAESIKISIDHLERKRDTWKILSGALLFFVMDIFSALSTLLSIHFWLIPWMEKNGIQSSDAAAINKFKHAIGMLKMTTYVMEFLTALTMLILTISIFVLLKGKGKAAVVFQEKVSYIPVLRSFFCDGALAETFGIVGRMLKGRVSFDLSCKTAAESTLIPIVKSLWNHVYNRVLLHGDTIVRAMQHPIITKAEAIEISAHQTSEHLSEIFLSLAKERHWKYQKGVKLGVSLGIWLTIAYIGVISLIAIWAIWIQNEGLSATMNSISSGF